MEFLTVISILFILGVSVLGTVEGSSSTCAKTPENFPAKYLRHCFERVQQSKCPSAWNIFANGFAYKDPSTVTRSDYEKYFDFLPIIAKPNESLFWSGTFNQSVALSCRCPTGANLISSSNTPSSAIINDIGDINWCGSTTDGIDYKNPCLCDVTWHFWDQFSIEFASVAKGTIFYLCNGERDGGAYRSNSAFAQFELPNLEYPRVTGAVVLNIHRKGKGEACGDGSLIDLHNDIKDKGISYTCYNIYGDVTDDAQTVRLSMCSSIIVNATQKGVEPARNDCYSKENNDSNNSMILYLLQHILDLLPHGK